MVIGFDRFREAFQDFAENYIVIGGSACDWLFTSRNAQFRATKDIDLVLVAERMSPAFATMIWEFVRAGGYSAYERKDGKKCFYRFLNPTAADYPFMLEFFAFRRRLSRERLLSWLNRSKSRCAISSRLTNLCRLIQRPLACQARLTMPLIELKECLEFSGKDDRRVHL